MTVTAVGTAHRIILAQGPAASNGSGFLTDTWMEGAANFALLVHPADGFFKFADDKHLPVSVRQSFWFERHKTSPLRNTS
jgi:hypothetical protein